MSLEPDSSFQEGASLKGVCKRRLGGWQLARLRGGSIIQALGFDMNGRAQVRTCRTGVSLTDGHLRLPCPLGQRICRGQTQWSESIGGSHQSFGVLL